MSSENSKNDLYKILILCALFVFFSIKEWVEEHPLTTGWLVGAVVFGVYLFYSSRSDNNSGTKPPPSPY